LVYASRSQAYCAAKLENKKIGDYRSLLAHLRTQDPTTDFFPVVLESYGAWGKQAVEYVKKLVLHARNYTYMRPDNFRASVVSGIAVCLQKQNARILLTRRLPRHQRPPDPDSLSTCSMTSVSPTRCFASCCFFVTFVPGVTSVYTCVFE
jgi:hypothetical protein